MSVSTNSNLTAATESWGKAKIEGAAVGDEDEIARKAVEEYRRTRGE